MLREDVKIGFEDFTAKISKEQEYRKHTNCSRHDIINENSRKPIHFMMVKIW